MLRYLESMFFEGYKLLLAKTTKIFNKRILPVDRGWQT